MMWNYHLFNTCKFYCFNIKFKNKERGDVNHVASKEGVNFV